MRRASRQTVPTPEEVNSYVATGEQEANRYMRYIKLHEVRPASAPPLPQPCFDTEYGIVRATARTVHRYYYNKDGTLRHPLPHHSPANHIPAAAGAARVMPPSKKQAPTAEDNGSIEPLYSWEANRLFEDGRLAASKPEKKSRLRRAVGAGIGVLAVAGTVAALANGQAITEKARTILESWGIL
jgi:hypothetical protein